jgi:glycosyltransferase involved in cell wall biosynthesis
MHEWPEIALIGSYPPPYGGISVHLKRLCGLLEGQGFSFVLFNTLSYNENAKVRSITKNKIRWFLQFCLFQQCKIVHLYSVNWYSRLVFGIFARLRKDTKYILSIHGHSIPKALCSSGFLTRKLSVWLLHQMDLVIACNPQIRDICLEKAGLATEKVRLIPAFIPPIASDESILSEDVRLFISKSNPLLSAVGWIGHKFDGQDLYGIDMMIELVKRLDEKYPQVGLILSVNGGKDEEVERTIKESCAKIGRKIFFITEDLPEVAPVISASDLFLRPTNTDGDSVAIREAIHLGVPVVASDAVPRPESCVLFKSRDIDDLENQVVNALQQLRGLRETVQALDLCNHGLQLLQVYEDILEEVR